MTLPKNTSFIAFGYQWSFKSHEIMNEVSYLASDCDSASELENLLKAEEVEYSTVKCKFVEPKEYSQATLFAV